MGRPRPQYTEVAAKAVSFADLFNAVFREGLPGPQAFRIELTEPSGPSTGGGRQALQHIRLLPADGGPAIVVGTASQVDKSAELRTHYHLSSIHAQRFNGAPFPIDAARYRELIDRLQRFLTNEHFRVVMVDVTSSIPPRRPSPSGGRTVGLLIALAVVVALALTTFLATR